MKSADDFESKLGDVKYTFTYYGKMKRLMMPLKHPDFSVPMVSFDASTLRDETVMKRYCQSCVSGLEA